MPVTLNYTRHCGPKFDSLFSLTSNGLSLQRNHISQTKLVAILVSLVLVKFRLCFICNYQNYRKLLKIVFFSPPKKRTIYRSEPRAIQRVVGLQIRRNLT